MHTLFIPLSNFCCLCVYVYVRLSCVCFPVLCCYRNFSMNEVDYTLYCVCVSLRLRWYSTCTMPPIFTPELSTKRLPTAVTIETELSSSKTPSGNISSVCISARASEDNFPGTAFTSVTSALEVFLNGMRYINPRFTYLLTYLWAKPLHLPPTFSRGLILHRHFPLLKVKVKVRYSIW